MYLDKEYENYIQLCKTLPYQDLNLFAVEIREFLIDKISKTGGHLASNLGAVELTIALHRVFDSPKDKLIFDVGHQSYVHKIITGRKNQFDNLRQIDGLSGFPKRSESVHDMYDSGHSSTSISAALGYAVARDLDGDDYSCVAIIGDGALSGGVAFEALNMAGANKTPLIVILNDNQMSIDGPIGGLTNHLNNLRTSSEYLNFKKYLKDRVKNKPELYKVLKNTRDTIKNFVIPGGYFEDMGFKYFGPIDGHNIEEMTEVFKAAKQYQRPVLIHLVTKKGKGFLPAEKNPSKFHGIGSFDPASVSSHIIQNKLSYSDIFGRKLAQLSEADQKICAVSAAMLCATGLNYMQESSPDRVFDVGIAEQNAVSFAAGLALNGKKPVVAIYSTFLQRAYDQIVSEIALQNLPVVFAIDRAGVTGQDGETHQGTFDIAYLNPIPNMTVLAPKDGNELEAMLEYALSLNSPCAIRFPRGNSFDLSFTNTESNLRIPELVSQDGEYAILALGSMVKESLDARELLKSVGYDFAVYNFRIVKPLPVEFLDSISKKYKKIITVEDGCLLSGFGQTVDAYYNNKASDINILNLGWPDKYIEHGKVDDLRHKYGLDSAGIAKACKEFIKK